MLIRLEFNGRILHEIASGAITGEIVIGRSHACAWPVPKEEAVCSSKHARLFAKGKRVWLQDLGSTNGTFHNGKRIVKKRLAVGDKIGIGNCVLCVEAERAGAGKVFSELQVLSGKGRGQRKPLLPPVFTIGSDPASNLVFLDMLVSRRHAEILVKEDGSCWIRDLGSKNGTAVNGMPLRDDKERLLKDGDRVAFSHLEVEFHDGAVARSNKQVWLRIFILALTLAAGISAYNAYQRARPSAEAFLREARRLAADEAFDEAAQAVEKAATARKASSNQVAIEELRRLLGEWRNTVTVWARAQEALAAGKWTQVSRDLGLLQTSRKDAWEWNRRAAGEKANMNAAKTMLDAYLRAEAVAGRDDAALQEIGDAHDGIAAARAQAPAEPPAALAPLLEAMEGIAERLAALLGEYRGLEQALDRLGEATPPYDEILGVVGRARQSREAAVGRRAAAVEPALLALAGTAKQVDEAVRQVRALRVAEALAGAIALPPSDLCAIDPRISRARQTLDQGVQNLRQKAGQFQMLLGEVDKRFGGAADLPECLAVFVDAELLARALACDVLEQPLPKRSRAEPAGAYDRLFGVEEFYTYLSAFPEPVNPAEVADLPFVSALTRLRELARTIEDLLAFVRQPGNEWLAGEAVQARVTRLEAVLARRDALVAAMVEKAAADTTRAGLIAGGIVARLAARPGQARIKGTDPEAWVAAELKRLRAPLLQSNGAYTGAAPPRQIEIRDEILARGLPGDPLVRRMWAFRDAAHAP